MAEARRVALDTHTVLSALLFVNGRLVPLRAAWQSGDPTASNTAPLFQSARGVARPSGSFPRLLLMYRRF